MMFKIINRIAKKYVKNNNNKAKKDAEDYNNNAKQCKKQEQ